MVAVGAYSTSQAKNETKDYLLAGRNVHSWVMALSTLSTNYSGFMFIGFIGYTYMHGISAVWYLITWALGDFVAWITVHKKLRERSEELDVNTINSFVGTSTKGQCDVTTKVAALLSFIFLGVYAAAQLKVSSKALHALLGWDYQFGIILAGIIVCIYCFSGGIRASMWTDVIQSILMYISMGLLVFLAIQECGGLEAMWQTLQQIDPNLLQMIPDDLQGHFWIFIISLILNGYAVIGQPHVMVRPMSIDSSASLRKARTIYFFAYVSFGLAATGVGLASRILMPEMMNHDVELTLPVLASQILPEILVGLILAGIFSASISTADSQIISCSASLTQDLVDEWKESYMGAKTATLLVTTLAVLIALFSHESVFDLTIIAWAVLGVSIGPLILMRCLGTRISTAFALTSMLVSTFAVLAWRYIFKLSDLANEVIAGTIAVLIVYAVASLLEKFRNKKR